MTTFKKIVLYLFGIALVIFGNRVAFGSLFGVEEVKQQENSTNAASTPTTSAETEKKSVETGKTTVEPAQTEEATATQ